MTIRIFSAPRTMYPIPTRFRSLSAGILLGACLLPPALAADSADATPLATQSELLGIADQYEGEINRIQSDQGPLAERLGELLQSQGRVYQQLDDHARAVDAMKRAYQIRRVNEGLEDMGQVPILLNIIESNIALRDWAAVDQNYDQLLWVYRRNYEEGDPALLDIYQQVGSWKIQAYRDNLLEDRSYQTVSEAAYLFTKTIEITEKRVGENDPRLVPLLYGHALTSYHAMIEFANRPLDTYRSRQASTVTYVQQCVPIRLPNGRIATQCYAVPVMNVGAYARAQDEKNLDVERRFLAARRSLERVVAIHDAHPETPPEQRAEALAHLGDWHLLRGSINTAMEHYQKAWHMLDGVVEGEEKRRALFGQPVALPALRMSIPSVDRQVSPEGAPNFVTVTYDVSKSGRVQNARITEATSEEQTASRRKAIDSVRGNKFRPRFENGVAVDTLGATKRFPLN